jgi:hypothetical protein
LAGVFFYFILKKERKIMRIILIFCFLFSLPHHRNVRLDSGDVAAAEAAAAFFIILYIAIAPQKKF